MSGGIAKIFQVWKNEYFNLINENQKTPWRINWEYSFLLYIKKNENKTNIVNKFYLI